MSAPKATPKLAEDALIQVTTPDGVAIVGTCEDLRGCAFIQGFTPDGDVEYAGETEIFWNDQRTSRREGRRLFMDERDRLWTLGELDPKLAEAALKAGHDTHVDSPLAFDDQRARQFFALDKAERDTIVAALALYFEHGYGDPFTRPQMIQNLAAPGADDTSLDQDAVAALIQRLGGALPPELDPLAAQHDDQPTP